MKKIGGGSIINMSSVSGLIGHIYTTEACTTAKGAVTLLTNSVASRYTKFNIRCNVITPSTADTPLVQDMLKDPERRKERLSEVPLGRMASLKDTAEAALSIASAGGSFINGVDPLECNRLFTSMSSLLSIYNPGQDRTTSCASGSECCSFEITQRMLGPCSCEICRVSLRGT